MSDLYRLVTGQEVKSQSQRWSVSDISY